MMSFAGGDRTDCEMFFLPSRETEILWVSGFYVAKIPSWPKSIKTRLFRTINYSTHQMAR